MFKKVTILTPGTVESTKRGKTIVEDVWLPTESFINMDLIEQYRDVSGSDNPYQTKLYLQSGTTIFVQESVGEFAFNGG